LVNISKEISLEAAKKIKTRHPNPQRKKQIKRKRLRLKKLKILKMRLIKKRKRNLKTRKKNLAHPQVVQAVMKMLIFQQKTSKRLKL
jgi:hypothetical protein